MNSTSNHRQTPLRRRPSIVIDMLSSDHSDEGYPKFTVQRANVAVKQRATREDINMSYQLVTAERRRKNNLCAANMKDFESTVAHASAQHCFLLCLLNESFRYQTAIFLKEKCARDEVCRSMFMLYRELAMDVGFEMSDPSVNNYLSVLTKLQRINLFSCDMLDRLIE